MCTYPNKPDITSCGLILNSLVPVNFPLVSEPAVPVDCVDNRSSTFFNYSFKVGYKFAYQMIPPKTRWCSHFALQTVQFWTDFTPYLCIIFFSVVLIWLLKARFGSKSDMHDIWLIIK